MPAAEQQIVLHSFAADCTVDIEDIAGFAGIFRIVAHMSVHIAGCIVDIHSVIETVVLLVGTKTLQAGMRKHLV